MTSSIRGDRVSLRPLRADDALRIAALAADPSVAEWWHGVDERQLRRWASNQTEAVSYAIELENDVVGLAQTWEERDADYRHAGIDLFLGASHQGAGIGSDVVRALARHLFEAGHHRVVIDPAAANERAIRCYEKIGFRRVGILRRYERSPGGEWRDGLLMDLLAGELRDDGP